MEHMVNFGIVVDDDAIQKLVEENIVRQVSADILKKVEENPGELPTETTYGRGLMPNRKVNWPRLVKQAVEDMAEDWKDDIVERTADKLLDSIKRTKKYKEKVAEVLDD